MRHYPVASLCGLSGVTRQAFYKRDDDLLFRRLALERFVVHFVHEIREQAHGMQGEMKRHWHSWREEAIKKQNLMVV